MYLNFLDIVNNHMIYELSFMMLVHYLYFVPIDFSMSVHIKAVSKGWF